MLDRSRTASFAALAILSLAFAPGQAVGQKTYDFAMQADGREAQCSPVEVLDTLPSADRVVDAESFLPEIADAVRKGGEQAVFELSFAPTGLPGGARYVRGALRPGLGDTLALALLDRMKAQRPVRTARADRVELLAWSMLVSVQGGAAPVLRTSWSQLCRPRPANPKAAMRVLERRLRALNLERLAAAGSGGTAPVVVSLMVDTAGATHDVVRTDVVGDAALAPVALEVLASTRFVPATLNGRPVPSHLTVPFGVIFMQPPAELTTTREIISRTEGASRAAVHDPTGHAARSPASDPHP